jgi:hypothetical protein
MAGSHNSGIQTVLVPANRFNEFYVTGFGCINVVELACGFVKVTEGRRNLHYKDMHNSHSPNTVHSGNSIKWPEN